MVKIEKLSVRFGKKTVLDGLELWVRPGERIALIGPSGVGKSTLLYVIAGLQKPSAGQCRINAAKVSMLFQKPRLLPWLTAAENVNCVLSDRDKTLPQALQWLQCLGLAEDGDKYPAQLSGGMQQRVAIARALAYGGDLVLLDEPFQGLDEATKAEALCLCRDQLAGRTAILVTHDREEAAALADRVYLLRPDGRLEEEV